MVLTVLWFCPLQKRGSQITHACFLCEVLEHNRVQKVWSNHRDRDTALQTKGAMCGDVPGSLEARDNVTDRWGGHDKVVVCTKVSTATHPPL